MIHRRTNTTSRRCRGDRGTVLETVIMVPIMLTMMMMLAQFAIAAYSKQVLAGAVEDGAAEAALLSSSDGQGRATAESLLGSADDFLTWHQIDVVRTDSQVVFTGQAGVIKVFPLLPSIEISASGAAAIEKWETP